jgi:hypothetical protein
MVWESAQGAPMPEGWVVKVSASKGKPYYYHQASNTTTWVHPGSSAAATRRAPEACDGPTRRVAVASVDDVPAVPDCLLDAVKAGTFPVMLKANTPAGSVVGVKVPAGFPGEGRLVTVLVPTNAPRDSCFWIIAPFPNDLLAKVSREDSDSWSSAAGSAASTVLHDSSSTGAYEEFDLDSLEDCPEGLWDFEQHEKEVRATAQALRALHAARTFSPDLTHFAPEAPAAPAILISRTPSPQELASPILPQPVQAENPFRRQLHLARDAESHSESLINSAALPAGWVKKMSASKGKPYYYNALTRVTTWVLPTE